MFLITIKLARVSFETKGRQNLQKTADFVIESIVFCPLVPPSWISLVDPTSAMYASAIYVSYIYGVNVIEIINNTRGGIEGKIGERDVWGQIQVPDVHSFTMSQTKKVVLDGFFNCFSQ